MITRRIGFVFLGLAAALAVALGLWLGVFERPEAAASPGVDLVITKTASPSEATLVVEGGTITYTLAVQNIGNAAATNVIIRDLAPTADLTLVSIAGTGGGGVTCSDTTGPDYDCTAASIAASGGTATVTAVFRVAAGSGSTVLNGAYVNPLGAGHIDEDNDEADDPGLDCAAVGEILGGTVEPDNFDCTSHTVGTVDLTITKSASPADGSTVATGATITYTVTVRNNAGTGTATNVPVREFFETPSKVSVQTVTASAPDACADTTLPEINCTIASLSPGASRTITVVVTVTASAGATILEGAYVDPDNVITETNEEADDPALSCAAVGEVAGGSAEPDNFDCTSHTVGTIDLTVTKSASPADGSTVATGATITYTVTAGNSSLATATANNVAIRDVIGTGLSLTSVTPGTGVTCSDTTAPDINCTATSIAPGESRTVTVVTSVTATSGTVLNGASVDPADAIDETNEDADDPSLDCAAVGEGNDAGEATEPDNFDCTVHTLGALDLTLTKTATPTDGSTVASGATITYTVTVSATGGTATNVAIRDIIGTGLSLTSVTPGTGVTCADVTAPEINCVAATIAAGSSVLVTVNTTVTATSGTVLNGARADAANAIAESNEDADDPGLDCTAVGEGSDAGEATEPDNFDCTSHTVGGAVTRTLDLSPAGWHNFVWTGATGTDPGTALSCLGANYSIAYEWVDSLQAWEHYVPGCALADLCTIDPLTKYDPLLVLITAANVTCQMPVAP